MQWIEIRHLGPLTNIKIEINQVNILIGEQATGKSTLSKAIYFFRSIKNEIRNYLIESYLNEKSLSFPRALNRPIKEMFIDLFGYSWDLDPELYMKYNFTEAIYIEVKLSQKQDAEKQYIDIHYSEELSQKIREANRTFRDSRINQQDLKLNDVLIGRAEIKKEIEKTINSIFEDDAETYYIPAGRNLLTLMANQKTKLNYGIMDLVNRNFMQLIESIQGNFENGAEDAYKFYQINARPEAKAVAKKMKHDLKGTYYCRKGNEYLELDNGEKVKINFISSGQQELLWLYNQLYILLLKNEKSFVIIEEPEAHLYPSLQKEVMDFIVQFSHINNSVVCITTHSPYMLVEVNTLYYAGRLHEKDNKKVETIVGEKNYIPPQGLSAYKLCRKGNTHHMIASY